MIIKNRLQLIISSLLVTFVSYLFVLWGVIYLSNRIASKALTNNTFFSLSLWEKSLKTSVFTYSYKRLNRIMNEMSQKNNVYFIKVELINGYTSYAGKKIPESVLKNLRYNEISSLTKKFSNGILSIISYPIKDNPSGFVWGRIILAKFYSGSFKENFYFFLLISIIFSLLIGVIITIKFKAVEEDFKALFNNIAEIEAGEKEKIEGNFLFFETTVFAEELNKHIQNIKEINRKLLKDITKIEDKIRKNREMIKVILKKIESRERELQRLKQEKMEAEQYESFITFISGLAHELNNPLTTVYGYLEIFANSKKTTPELKAWAERIVEEIAKIQFKMNEYTDIISQTGLLSQEFVNVKKILESACREKGIEFIDNVGSKLFSPGNPTIFERSIKTLFNFLTENGKNMIVKRLKDEALNKINISVELKEGVDIEEIVDRIKKLIHPFRFTLEVLKDKLNIHIFIE